MKHEILMKVWEELGTDKPHKAPEVKEEKQEEAKRPLSPVEPGTAAVAAELPIQVKTDGEGETVKTSDTVDVKEESTVTAEDSTQPQNGRVSTTQTPTAEAPARKGGRGRKKGDNDTGYRPYEGLFEATFKPDNDKFEIKDLRDGIEGGQKTWMEDVNCLVCGTRIC